MANILLCEPSLSDAATMTASSSATGMGVTRLQTSQPKEVWETTTVTTDQTVTMDLGTSASYDTFALLFTNATDVATWSIDTATASDTGPWTARLAATTLRAVGQDGYTRTHAFYRHASTLTDRYAKITIGDATNTDAAFRAGRLYVCDAYQPTINADFGLALGFDDPSPVVITTANERIVRNSDPIPTLSFTLTLTGASAWAEAQANLFNLLRARGASRDVMVVVDPTDSSYLGRLIHYGTLQQRTAIALPSFHHYQTAIELTGLI